MTEAEYEVVLEIEELFESRPPAEAWALLETFDRRRAGPDVVEAGLCSSYCRLGQIKRAMSTLQAIKRRAPSAWSLIAEAEVAMYHEELQQAAELSRQALNLDPSNCEALDVAFNAVTMLGRFDEADGYAERYVRAHPRRQAAYQLYVVAPQVRKDFAETRKRLERAPEEYVGTACYWRDVANLAFEDQRVHEALSAYSTAVELNPYSPLTWCMYANALRAEGRLPDAQHAIDQALALDPTYPAGVRGAAQLAADRGDYKLQQELRASFVQSGRQKSAAYGDIAASWLAQGSKQHALQAYEQMSKSSSFISQGLARMGKLQIHTGMRNWDEMRKLLAALAPWERNESAAVVAAAMLAANEGNPAVGSEMLEEFFRRDRTQLQLNQWLILLLQQANKLDQLRTLVQDLTLNPPPGLYATQTLVLSVYHSGAIHLADTFLAASLERFPESNQLILLKLTRLVELGKREEARTWRRKLPLQQRWRKPPRMMRYRQPFFA